MTALEANDPIDLADDLDLGLAELPGDELHRTLHALRRRGPITQTRFLGLPAYVITGHAALKAAFLDVDRFPPHRMYEVAFEGAIGETFISMADPARHRVYRKLATPAFRARAIARSERGEVEALAGELIDELLDTPGPVDLMAGYAARLPYLVISRMLGVPRERESEFHAWALALLRFRESPDEAAFAAGELTAAILPELDARRREPREDVLSELLAARVDGRALDDESIVSHIRLLFPTGGETMHGALGNLLSRVLQAPALWERMKADPSTIPAVVDEGLRCDSSVAVLPRMSASRTVDFEGVTIPPDSWVLFAIAAANRDPAVFGDPDRFDPDRRENDALTFGRGVKSCPGMHLARRNIAVAMQALLERAGDARLVDVEAAIPKRMVLRCPEALRVELS